MKSFHQKVSLRFYAKSKFCVCFEVHIPVIVALDAIHSAKENGHEGQVCHVWSFFFVFFGCHGCHEIKSNLPLMPFLPRKKVSWHPRPHWLLKDASNLAKNFL